MASELSSFIEQELQARGLNESEKQRLVARSARQNATNSSNTIMSNMKSGRTKRFYCIIGSILLVVVVWIVLMSTGSSSSSRELTNEEPVNLQSVGQMREAGGQDVEITSNQDKVAIESTETPEPEVDTEQQQKEQPNQISELDDSKNKNTTKTSNENLAPPAPETEQPTENLKNNTQTENKNPKIEKNSENSKETNSTEDNASKISEGSEDAQTGISVPIPEVENQQKNKKKQKKDERRGIVERSTPPVTGESRLHQGNHLRGIDLDPRRIDPQHG